MKDSTLAQKMRVTAGVFYAILAIYQMAATHTVILGATLSNASVVWMAAVLLIPLAAAMSIWMFSSHEVFSAGVRSAVVVGTIIAIAFEIITYTQQTNIINYTLANLLPGLYNQSIALYGFLVVRLLIMVLAAFFVTSCKDSYDYKSAPKDKGVEAAPVEVAKAAAGTPAGELDKPLAVTTTEDERKKAEAALEKAEKAEKVAKEEVKDEKKD